MASSPPDPAPQRFQAPDGTVLAWREIGKAAAAPLVLLHGLFSNAQTNWIRYGHAARIAAAGFRVILPDLRGHGESEAPHDPARWPPDILADDGAALIRHLGLTSYDLGGYSLGGRTVLRMLARGARPRRAVIAGMGLDGVVDPDARSAHFLAILDGLGRHPRGSPGYFAEAFLKSTGTDPQAMRPLLGSFVPTPRDVLATLTLPVLVACGQEDEDNGSAEALAAALPQARYVALPGTHMSAVTKSELGQAIVDFLAAPLQQRID